MWWTGGVRPAWRAGGLLGIGWLCSEGRRARGGWSQDSSEYLGGKVVRCREAGFWGTAGEALCCALGLGKRWDAWEICRGGGGGVGQESSQAVATWGEVVEKLCLRKMGNV